MTEAKALILVFIGISVLASVTGIALAVTDAVGTALGFAIVFLAGFGGVASSRVVMHYGSLKERQQREATLLRPR